MDPHPQVRTDDLHQELRGLEGSLSTVVENLPETPDENEVWRAYANTEKIVAKLKLRLDVERPGVFQEIPTSSKPEEFLSLALEHMRDGIRDMEQNRLLESLETLRKSRNYLRGYLAEKRKVRLREARRAKAARRSSASP